MTVRVYTRLIIEGKRQSYKKVNLKKLYPNDTLFTLGSGGKKPLTLPPGTSLKDAVVAAKQKEIELMQTPVQPPVVVEVSRLRLRLESGVASGPHNSSSPAKGRGGSWSVDRQRVCSKRATTVVNHG
jgi:hypothetical protein